MTTPPLLLQKYKLTKGNVTILLSLFKRLYHVELRPASHSGVRVNNELLFRECVFSVCMGGVQIVKCVVTCFPFLWTSLLIMLRYSNYKQVKFCAHLKKSIGDFVAEANVKVRQLHFDTHLGEIMNMNSWMA